MEIFALQCFVEVIRAGSFSKAAERVLRTQPAVSLQVRKLERELGRRLVGRAGRRAVPTEEGQLLYERARPLLGELAGLRDLLTAAPREPHGRLTIASNLALIDNLLPAVLGEYHRRWPAVQLSLLNLRSEQILRALLDGTADVGFGYLAARHRQIERRDVGQAEFFRIEPRADPANKDETRPFLHFEKGIELRRYLERHLGALEVALELPSLSSILRYVRSGFGYSILPEFALPPSARVGLSAIPLAGRVPSLAIEIYTVRGRLLPAAAQACLHLMEKAPQRSRGSA